MIKITKELLTEWFNEFNNEFFNGEISTPTYVITHNRSRFGQFRPRTWVIEISTAWVRSERDYKNTFIHEMAHAYVRQKYGRFAQSHGYEWKSIANKINSMTCGKYGTIQRCGGGQDSYTLRSANAEKFIVFTDYNGNLATAKYRDEKYVERLKNRSCVKSGTEMYYVISDMAEMDRLPIRKVNVRSIRWNYLPISFESLMANCVVVRKELYTNLKKVG